MVVCVRRGEGGSFYSPRRSVPARNNYGNIWEPPYVDKIILPAKTWVIWRQHGAGRPCGSAGPRVAPRVDFRPGHCQVGPQLVYVSAGALYVSFLCQMGLFWMCNTAAMFCVSLLCILRVFMLFPTCVPAINNSPTLVEFVSNNSYHYC